MISKSAREQLVQAVRKTKKDILNDTMAFQIKAAGLPEPDREVKLVSGRDYLWDFFWPQINFWLEVDGGEWMERGGHNTGAGITRDREKDIALFFARPELRGFRVTGGMVESGFAFIHVEKLFKGYHDGNQT